MDYSSSVRAMNIIGTYDLDFDRICLAESTILS
jgi:hypothetical protein